jgi:peptide/nickel transport system substrate-binding protein
MRHTQRSCFHDLYGMPGAAAEYGKEQQMPRLRLISVLMLLILIATTLAACGGGPAETSATAAPAPPTAASAAQPTAAPAEQPTAAPAEQPTAAPAEQATAAPAPATGGIITIGRTAAPDSLNPGAGYLSEAFDIWYLAYDALTTTDLRNVQQPQLAKEWSVSEDGKTWTFILNDGAKWSDGKPLTAEDVAFTWNMIKGFESFALIKDYTSLLVNAEAKDPTTAVLTFEQPVANVGERFSSVFILPKHIWEQFKDETAAVEFENTDLVGSGPFKLAEYKPGEFTRLTANKDHYLNPPKIDEVIFKVYGNDDALVQALKSGEVDLIDPPNTAIKPLQGEQNIKVEIGKSLSLSDIIFNITTKENCPKEDGKCTGHPALKDVKVRQALSHATDKQQLIDVMLLGLGQPGMTLVMPGHGEGFNSSLQDYAYDVEKAKQILEEAGYKDTNGDSIREMPNDPATQLIFRYSYPSDQQSDGQRFAELLKDMWKQAGVDLQITPLEADALTAICCPAFDFDVIRWGWGAGSDPSSLLYITTTDEIPTGTSETGYSNPEYDKLFDEQEITVDAAKRKEILWKLQEILLRDVPYIIAYYADNVQAYRTDRFQGYVVDPEGLLDLSGRISLTAISPVQ